MKETFTFKYQIESDRLPSRTITLTREYKEGSCLYHDDNPLSMFVDFMKAVGFTSKIDFTINVEDVKQSNDSEN